MIGSVNVRLKGPTVEGLAEPAIDAMLAGATAEVADYTKFEVLMQLDSVLQNPTGYYESQVRSEPLDEYNYSVNDGNVIYGPWLEGLSSRNQTTRFKGYGTFRIVKNRMAQKTQAIVDAWVSRTVGRL
jgi:hypothetical protein